MRKNIMKKSSILQILYNQPPEVGNFWLLDFFLILGGSHRKPQKVWQLGCWYIYQLLTLIHYCIQLLAVIENLSSWESTTATVWSFLSFLTMTICYAKQLILWRYADSVQVLKLRLNEQQYNSGDSTFDSNVRNEFYGTSQKMISAMMVIVLLDQLFISTPNALRDKLFAIPRFIHSYDERIAYIVCLFFHTFFALVWVSKLFCCSATVASLLIGLRAEFRILAHKFNRSICDTSSIHESFRKHQLIRVHFWKLLYQRIGAAVQHHNSLLSDLRALQSIFEKFFFLIYYQSLVVVGASFYVILSEKPSLCSVAIVACVSLSVAECYWWCHLVDSFEEVNEAIAEHVHSQCIQLPYTADHRSDYVKMRSSLLIISMRARSSVSFSCAGIFKISTSVFATLVNISYSVLTFLLNVL